MQKDFSGKVRRDCVSTPHLINVMDVVLALEKSYSQCSWFSLLLLKDEHHGDHATDEEKLASSVSVQPDKDESSE